MRSICVAIPEPLYQKLEASAQEKNLKISDIVRTFLRAGVENQRSDECNKVSVNHLQEQIARYTMMTYCLTEEAMQRLVTEGAMLSEKSHRQAEKLINHVMSKSVKVSAS